MEQGCDSNNPDRRYSRKVEQKRCHYLSELGHVEEEKGGTYAGHSGSLDLYVILELHHGRSFCVIGPGLLCNLTNSI